MAIDRRRLVRAHNPVYTSAHPTAVLSVGNGNIAMSVDVSGLQTFPRFHEIQPDPRRVLSDGLAGLPEQAPRPFDADDFQIPLRTQSTWGWYRTRTVRDFQLGETETVYQTSRGPVRYPDRMGLQRAGDPIAEELQAGAWFHYNPRRAHLGRLALVGPGGRPVQDPSDLVDVRTELDLWSGIVHATYLLDGERVAVTTIADPAGDAFAVRIESDLLERGWGIAWVFDAQPDDLASFELPLDESTSWTTQGQGRGFAERVVESTQYVVAIETTGSLAAGSHHVIATADSGRYLDVVAVLGHDGATSTVGLSSFEDVRVRADTATARCGAQARVHAHRCCLRS